MFTFSFTLLVYKWCLLCIQNSEVIGTITSGSVFGELAILYNCMRTATVTARGPTKTWMLERTVYQKIMRTMATTKRNEMIEVIQWQVILKPLVSCFLRNLNVFKNIMFLADSK